MIDYALAAGQDLMPWTKTESDYRRQVVFQADSEEWRLLVWIRQKSIFALVYKVGQEDSEVQERKKQAALVY